MAFWLFEVKSTYVKQRGIYEDVILYRIRIHLHASTFHDVHIRTYYVLTLYIIKGHVKIQIRQSFM